MDEEENAQYRWERGAQLHNTLDAVREDASGRLVTSFANAERERSLRAKAVRLTESVRRGIIRYLVLCLDTSLSAKEVDYFPTRLAVCKHVLSEFVVEYYDQNPISQLSLAVTQDRVAEKLTDLAGNAKYHMDKLRGLKEVRGLASLQNTLLLAMATLQHTPSYGCRELLVVYSALSSCDPGDVWQAVEDARRLRVRVSIVCLAAEVFLCRRVCELTGGSFAVATDREHLRELLMAHAIPPAELLQEQDKDPQRMHAEFIYMGFPKRHLDTHTVYGFENKRIATSTDAFLCPRCTTRTTDIPTVCCVCGLQLNSSSHIARSFHHLFPVPNFLEHTVCFDAQRESFVAVYSEEDANQNENERETETETESEERKSAGDAMDVEHDTDNDNHNNRINNNSNHRSSSNERVVVKTERGADTEIKAEIKTETDTLSLSLSQRTRKQSPRCILLEEEKVRCRGCLQSIASAQKTVWQCPRCEELFCGDCDLFIHDSLHNCPGCIDI